MAMTTITKTKATRDANERARKAGMELFELKKKFADLEQQNKDLRYFNSVTGAEVKNILVDAVGALRLYADPKTYSQRPFAALPIFEPFSMITNEDHEVIKLTDETPPIVCAGKKAREFFRKMEGKV